MRELRRKEKMRRMREMRGVRGLLAAVRGVLHPGLLEAIRTAG
jgi:hypothetical protein